MQNVKNKPNSLPETEASFNEVYRKYKYRANIKNLKFNLSKKKFRLLTSSNCFYCGNEPKTKSRIHEIRHNGVYIYNGIDRFDNTKGYTYKNSVPCCEICNKMKLELSFDQFKNHIIEIYKNLRKEKK